MIYSRRLLRQVSFDNIFSREFYDLLNSKERLSSISKKLNSNGYASGSNLTKPVPILSSETCKELSNRTIPNLFRGCFDTNIYPDEWHWREGISKPQAAREMCNSWKSSRMIASIVLNERLGEFVSKIMGWQSVRIAQDDIVVKPPAYQNNLDEDTMEKRIDTVGFHQDSAYISIQFLPYESNSVTVWMAIDDTDEENGCLEYAVGSHLWRPILHSHPTNEEEAESSKEKHDNSIISSFHDSDETSYRSALLGAHFAHKRECEMKENSVPLLEIQSATPVKAGHAIIHHQDVWHGSGPNKSDTRYRRALVGHYIRGDSLFVNDDSNASTHPFGKSSYIYGRYKKYQSTELEETFFPIIYASKQDDTTIENNRTEWIDDYVLKFP